MFIFYVAMAVCIGMVVYGLVTFTVRLRRQRARRDLASTRLDERDIAIMASETGETPDGAVTVTNNPPAVVRYVAPTSASRISATGQSAKASDLTPLHPLPSHRLIGFRDGSGPMLDEPR